MILDNDTIAAIATPLGNGGGIGIIRVSGPRALDAVSQIFSKTVDGDGTTGRKDSLPGRKDSLPGRKDSLPGRKDSLPGRKDSIPGRKDSTAPGSYVVYPGFESHRAMHGYIFNPQKGTVIDEVIILPMLAPRSYTAEDVVEIQAHSGPLVLGAILDTVFSAGVRPAEPGEFTKRAFLNGRIDLTQAEAVMDIIHAKSMGALNIAVSQGLGYLGDIISSAREKLISLLTRIEAAIDFPDETGDILPSQEAASIVEHVIAICKDAVRQHDDAGFIREGMKLAICGPPNAGKSSLMNRLLHRDRSIVTPVPGTTRDLIEEYLNIEGIPFVISDTAGVHHTDDIVEKIGIERTKKHISQSDMILFVKEAGSPLRIGQISSIVPNGRGGIVVLNKIDRLDNDQIDALPKEIHLSRGSSPEGDVLPVAAVSALYNVGIEELKKKIAGMAAPRLDINASLVPNARHKNALKNALEHLESAYSGLTSVFEEETLAIDIKNGINALGEITGDSADVDVLDRIFSTFCIGK
ncbi:MAG: tRNA uridine-5-carboxymethylaminomethyl(34) synthesis GTPase MnmE [Desulfamplus sp.]|nr:tRNA uridine-5-carboxymethylaminomethyl(34) synthesis GTPase MnmE [Desulfamplus sp.]